MISSDRSNLVLAFTVAAIYCTIHFLLYPRIQIRDVDAYHYMIGARSIALTGQYSTVDGVPITHWPPGYSALLSIFPDRLAAANVINTLCASLVVMMIVLLAIQADWSKITAISLGLAIGFGWLSAYSTNATPDALNTGLFLVAAYFTIHGSRLSFFIVMTITPILIAFKLISVVFVPALAIERFLQRKDPIRLTILHTIIGLLFSLLIVLFLLVDNHQKTGSFISESHDKFELQSTILELANLFSSQVRELFSRWSATIKQPVGFTVTTIMIILFTIAIFSSTPTKKSFESSGRLGVILLVLMISLRLTRSFSLATRLTGSAFMLSILSFLPRPHSRSIWCAYAVVMFLGLMIHKSMYLNDAGNDQRYIDTVYDISANLTIVAPDHGMVFTNMSPLLDVHTGIPSKCTEPEKVTSGEIFVYLTMPNYPPIATVITPIDSGFSEANWYQLHSCLNYTIYRKR